MSARPGTSGGSSGMHPSSLRTNMSSFIRDTLYSLPQRGGAGGTGGGAHEAGPQTVSLTSPRTRGAAGATASNGTAGGAGSHSSKFAVLNSLQQQQQANQPVAGDVMGGPPPPSGGGARHGPAARNGLDLSSLLAGVGQQHARQQQQQHHQQQPAEQSASVAVAEPQQQPQPPARRVPRTLSGRPRPNLASANARRGSSGTARTKPTITSNTTSNNTSTSDVEGTAPVSARTAAVVAAGGDDPNRPREDQSAPPMSMNAHVPAQHGTAAPSGNQTARGGRPSSAAVPVDPLTGSSSGTDVNGVPAAAIGTMATLGGCATGPDFRGMQPARVAALYERNLSKYERREVLDYDDVYFIGPDAAKTDAPVANAPNFGYDDDRGDYLICKNDHIAYRYEVCGELGRGSFGQVLRAKDYKRNCECALKIIRNRRRFHQQAQVEIRLLEHLRSRDPDDRSCTVRMLNYFQFRSHTCITFEVHAMNLYELTKLNRYQPFPPALIKRFTGQLLVAVSFMWREQIVHCDLKPENILLKQENKTGIKVIDFGSSCFESERVYSYIQSRFYRAPEIMLGMPYGRPIDLWSIGCIICEMAIGFPIFPGENEHDQLLCIMELLGVPPARLVDKSPRKSKFFETSGQPKIVPNSRNRVHRPSTKDLQTVLRTDDATFVDFIMRFLKWDPAERVTPNEAMRHPFIAECFHQDTIPAGPSAAAASTGASSTGGAAPATPNSTTTSQVAQPTPPAPSASTSTPASTRNSRPSSGMPEQQPAAPMHSVGSRQPSASTARGAGRSGLHQLGALGPTTASSGGSYSARGALPSIGQNAGPSTARRTRGTAGSSGRMQFASSNDMFL